MSECPPRVKLLALIAAGEHVPHLAVCEECMEFVDAAAEAVRVFRDRSELEAAVRDMIDALIDGVPSHRWSSVIVGSRELHRSVVIRDLLRRADEEYENPRVVAELTFSAVALCKAMASAGTPPSPELVIDALKEHSTALRCTGDLRGALNAIEQAWAVTEQVEHGEQLRAVLSLCKAITYAEPDLGKFDEAISLAENAAAVLELCGDERHTLLARQTKAYALAAMNRFDVALEAALPVASELDQSGSLRDATIAHNLVAYCSVGTGAYDEALRHAALAKCGYADAGNAVLEARACHLAARALAGLGRFDEARAEFDRTAEVFFTARAFDVWTIGRLDYIAAALDHDPAADVRAVVETVAHVCLTLGGDESTMRRRYAAEALEYLRRVAMRDALTAETANYVRDFVALNVSRPPVRFTPPSGGQFVM